MNNNNVLEQGCLTVREAAQVLHLSRSTLYALMEQGELSYFQFGGARRIPRVALQEYAEANLRGSSKGRM
jgi:excisionase family DNA binding protein